MPATLRAPILLAASLLAAGCARAAAETPGPVHAGTVTAILETVPAPPIAKRDVLFRLRLSGPQGKPLSDASVTLSLTMPGMKHGANEVSLRPVAPGVYEGHGVLVMPGRWQAAARVDRPAGRTELRIPFRVPR